MCLSLSLSLSVIYALTLLNVGYVGTSVQGEVFGLEIGGIGAIEHASPGLQQGMLQRVWVTDLTHSAAAKIAVCRGTCWQGVCVVAVGDGKGGLGYVRVRVPEASGGGGGGQLDYHPTDRGARKELLIGSCHTSLSALKLLVCKALSYQCMRPSGASV